MNIISPFKEYYDFTFPFDTGEIPWVRITKEFEVDLFHKDAINVFSEYTSSLRSLLKNTGSSFRNLWRGRDYKRENGDTVSTQVFILIIGEEVFFVSKKSTTKLREYEPTVELSLVTDLRDLSSEYWWKYGPSIQDQNELKRLLVSSLKDKESPVTIISFIGRSNSEVSITYNASINEYAGIIPRTQLEVYNLVQNYLSEMHKDKAIPATGGDEVLIQQKGFDKHSFRNTEPPKRKQKKKG